VLHCVVVAAVVRRDDRGCGGWFDEDGSGGSCGEAGLVGGDVIDGVGCDLGRVDLYGAHFSAIDVCRDAEVEVSLRARDCRAEVVVGSADLHDCRVVAVYLDHRPGVDATAVARDADWCDEVAVGGRACGEADARCCSADVSWPAADMASWAINSIEDVIELQSWSVSVSGSPIGTAAVSAWASGTRKRVAASIAARIEGFTWPLSHAAAGHEVVGGENGEE
jgi:hypothetical protein